MEQVHIKRTTTGNPGFVSLIQQLDNELWNELLEDQATYDHLNKVPDIQTAVVIFLEDEPAACGCFKEYSAGTMEVKRMFVTKDHRGRGLSKIVLQELEDWAISLGFKKALLETSIHFNVAQNLYAKHGYTIIPNYPPYVGLAESACMGKTLVR